MKRIANWINLIRKPIIKMLIQVVFWRAVWLLLDALIHDNIWVNLVTVIVVGVCVIPANYRVLVGDRKPGKKKKNIEVKTEIVPDNKPVEM